MWVTFEFENLEGDIAGTLSLDIGEAWFWVEVGGLRVGGE